jgi:uncharacterized protein (DUF58 family)
MGYRGPAAPLSKLDYGSALAAALAYLLLRQQDAAGLVTVAAGVLRAVAPRATASHLSALTDTLEALRAAGRTSLGAAVDHLVEKAPRRSQVLFFTDLLDADPQVVKRIAQLRRRKHEVSVFQVLDPAELDFPFHDPTLFLSLEDDRQVEAHGNEVRAGYLDVLQRWLGEVKRQCAEADVDYALCRTDRPLDEVLLPFLARRERSAA